MKLITIILEKWIKDCDKEIETAKERENWDRAASQTHYRDGLSQALTLIETRRGSK